MYFSLVDRKPVSEYRHAIGWKKIYHDTSGTLSAVIDFKNHGYLYSPVGLIASSKYESYFYHLFFTQVKEMLLRIPDFPVHQRGLLWESASRTSNVFIAWNDTKLDIFVYHSERLTGLPSTYSESLKLVLTHFI